MYTNISEDSITDNVWPIRKYKTKKYKIVFDPFQFVLSMFFYIGIICLIIYYSIVLIVPNIKSFGQLTSSSIPNEIEYFHQILKQQNQTINDIESKILTTENILRVNQIIQNLEQITSQLNVTQLQNNIQNIVNDLNKVIHIQK